ncbi:ABC transporter permease subunit [Celerinatantimonas sp. MCCC 1A17872]|uniref:ABC transporter permease subunit n=1 Tax=Celerinatantimonas sp. MCCC 1A17872 TaxID=3177514 RepID=UPI0038BE507E
MAQRSQSIVTLGTASVLSVGVISLILLLALSGIWQAGQGLSLAQFNDPYLWHVLWFSFYQAALSATLSLVIGVWLGRALFYLRAKGTRWWLYLASVCFIAPVILVVLGVVGAFGIHGIWARVLFQSLNIYGLTGILLAHLFLNIPLFVRHSYLLWQSIASSHWQQAEQLGLTPMRRFRYLEWPLLAPGLVSSWVLVFLLCFGSFTIVLALGGGPAHTTLEVAIYQALKYSFEPTFALYCALLQLVIALALTIIFKRQEKPNPIAASGDYRPASGSLEKLCMRASLGLAALFFGSVIIGMFTPLIDFNWHHLPMDALFRATFTSLAIALLSWLFCIVLVFALSYLLMQSWALHSLRFLERLSDFYSSALLYLPPMVISTGLFFWLWLHGYQVWLWPLVALVNALMSLPFVSRIIKPQLWQLQISYQHLMLELGLSRWQSLRLVYLPVLARPLALASAFALVLSLGDMGVVALLGDTHLLTLPLLIYQQLGHYQFAGASVTGLWLMLLCLVIFAVINWVGERSRALC